MNKNLIIKELDKGDYFSRRSPNVMFSTCKLGNYFIINLKLFPPLDSLFLRLCYLFRKYGGKK
jgi:hypothetical protein